ncbi:sulfur oxidation c-type cytochrome SoxA [Thiomicrospira pelophila]|uniref:sulfur oxidation c-type cytochrome SoxA n=1 Tax=Thiomicrospira pelophila TaxID=934 RepID=UPI0004A76731|nr:sulfur oxidation c-type cytochrome SoxA [Thiomicrospira pelophila]
MKKPIQLALAAAIAGCAISAQAKESSVDDYRAMLGDSPGILWVEDGELIWKQKTGPKNTGLEKCDLGKGPGVLKGAYAELPRYFKDTDQVMDLESRIKHCMITLQGKDASEIDKAAFSNPKKYIDSDMEKIVAYVAAQSNGLPFNIKLDHPKEQVAYDAGETLFWRRSSKMDFSCATCHAQDGKRIRLQTLYNAYNKDDGQIIASWPTYRVSHSTVRTMQHRMWDCHWQMRLPDIDYASDAANALITFMTKEANGSIIQVPSIKR